MTDETNENARLTVEVARIAIVRVMTDDDLTDTITTADGNGDPLGLAEALGMMRLAEDTLIRSRLDTKDEV